MAAAKKMDELLVSWLSNDATYESILELVETYQAAAAESQQQQQLIAVTSSKDPHHDNDDDEKNNDNYETDSQASPRGVIPPFYPTSPTTARRRRRTPPPPHETWEAPFLPGSTTAAAADDSNDLATSPSSGTILCVRDMVRATYQEFGHELPPQSPPSRGTPAAHDDDDLPMNTSNSSSLADTADLRNKYLLPEHFVRITKDICRFPSFFNGPLYQRIVDLWNAQHADHAAPMEVVTYDMVEWFWRIEMEPYDMVDRFFRLVKQPNANSMERNDFLPFIKALLADHPGLEFLSNHAEFQEKYAITVITRIFYSVDTCHSGRISSRQLRRSDLLEAFQQVDEEEDINKVTRYLSYEHFYVLYCRFWELDHDRDYKINKDDLVKYGDHSLSHIIVERILEAAPRPFESDAASREYMTYESFIYFMLSEEDKSNEVSVRYWFHIVDVDGDGKLNNMEMRALYNVQMQRVQTTGHEVVPFEDMLCQMMDMIKPTNPDYFVVEDFLQPECCHVSGALFDALFNLNKYLLFEQRDPFVERQKREDEFFCDWDRFACIDYNRLAMEEEAREEEAMEIDWVTVDDEDDAAAAGGPNAGQQAGGGGDAPY